MSKHINTFFEKDTIVDILEKNKCPKQFGILSLDIDGMDYEFFITATTTKEKMVIYEAFVKAGGMFINSEITEKKDYNISGEIDVAME